MWSEMKLKENNQGFSLVELLVVITIAAVLSGMAVFGVSLAFSRDVERCAKTINVELERARMDAMSRRGVSFITIDRVDQTVTINRDTNPSDGVAGTTEVTELQSQVELSFFNGVDATATAVNEDEINIFFDPSNGSVLRVTNGAGNAINGVLFQIRAVNQNGTRVVSVVLVRSTGKHYVEYGL